MFSQRNNPYCELQKSCAAKIDNFSLLQELLRKKSIFDDYLINSKIEIYEKGIRSRPRNQQHWLGCGK